MILTIRDETASGSVTNELIRSRVYQQVPDYNLRQRQSIVPDGKGKRAVEKGK